MEPLITTDNLCKNYTRAIRNPGFVAALTSLFNRAYETTAAVANVSLTVHAGECLGLVGANGAGKTTLVKMLSGIIYPTSGTVSVLGQTPSDRSIDFRRNIALVMGQKAQLWWDLPASDCFLLLKDIYAIDDAVYNHNLEELVTLLEIPANLLRTQVRRLSLGERMKMEIIAALLHRPKVVFLDEPTIGLDISAQKALRRFINAYRLAHQPAIILTSHYMEDIAELCERVVIMRQGSLVYNGKLRELLAKFSPQKTVRGSVGSTQQLSPQLCAEFSVTVTPSGEFSFRVPPQRLRDALQKLLSICEPADLVVEEEDISLLIERVMRGESVA